MFFCHSSRLVSSTGEAEAMPALETTMSMPPKARAASSKQAITAASSVTSSFTPIAASRP